MRGTPLFEMAKSGEYVGYETSVLVDVLAKALSLVPCWTRLYRIQRDIPIPLVSSGAESGNLRQLVLERMQQMGTKCRDIRTREVGIQFIHHKVNPDQVELVRRDYTASSGWETFLSYEDIAQDILVGMLRLRKPTINAHRPELQPPEAVSMIRELHVYGTAVPVHSRDPRYYQHQGYGALLVEEAERIARDEHGSTKILVIAGVGTRHYYRKLGYEQDGPYMSKLL
eukprot:TRINITY_DN2709_c0_g1_i2.p1 TRINITY_DN2709_c0_g1~~TRINITY_DN2709_c0_g1_i2.p1  ORF type:complete len:227 (+),score=41.66 TRINITY_DN2709_c0_g1_i2:154-834(+)